MGGTLTLWPDEKLASQYVDFGRLERSLDSNLVFCTLLGPEGPGRFFEADTTSGPTTTSVVTAHGPRSLANRRPTIIRDTVGTGKTRYRPYFENYTVDASILETARRHRRRTSVRAGGALDLFILIRNFNC